MMKKILLLLLLTVCSNQLWAQDDDTTSEGYAVGVPHYTNHILSAGFGTGQMRDTYLTPLLYSGTTLNVRYEREQQPKLGLIGWQRYHMLEADWLSAEHGDGNSSSWAGRARYRFAMPYKFLITYPYELTVGPYAGFDLGFDYNLRMASSNNPATARATVNAGAIMSAAYAYKLRNMPCYVKLQIMLPLAGAALMPEYGASYYETFYLNNAGRRVHFTSLHNQQDFDARLTTTIPMAVVPCFSRSGSALRVGVAYHIETMDINNIVTRQSSLQFVLGWVWRTMPFNIYRK